MSRDRDAVIVSPQSGPGVTDPGRGHELAVGYYPYSDITAGSLSNYLHPFLVFGNDEIRRSSNASNPCCSVSAYSLGNWYWMYCAGFPCKICYSFADA